MVAKKDTVKTTTFTLPGGTKVTCSEELAKKIQGSAPVKSTSK